MGPQHLGPQRDQEGSILEVDKKAKTFFPYTPENLRRSLRLCKGDVTKRSGHPLRGKRDSEPLILSPKKGYDKKKSYSRPLQSQSSNSVPVIQDGFSHTCQGSNVPGSLANLNRPQGSLLAYPDSQVFPEIPSLLHDGGGILFSSNAIRPQHCPQNFHEDMCSPCKGPKTKGNSGLCLSGRLADSGQNERRIHHSHKQSNKDPYNSRVLDKLQEIGPLPFSEPNLVRLGVVHDLSHGFLPQGQSPGPKRNSYQVSDKAPVHQKRAGEFGRNNQLGLQHAPCQQGQTKGGEWNSETFGQEVSEGHEDSYVPGNKREPNLVEESGGSVLVSAFCDSPDIPHNNHGCIDDRVGIPHLSGTRGPGAVVPILEVQTHKCSGVYGGLHSSKVSEYASSLVYPYKERQFLSDQLSQERGFSEVDPPEQDDSPDFQLSGKEELVPGPSSCGRQVQCPSGSPLERGAHIDGMAAGSGLFQMVVPADIHAPPSRLICHSPQQATGMLRVPDFDDRSVGSGCLSTGLEPMELDIHLSPDSPDFSGFGSPGTIQGRGSPSGSLVAKSGLVPEPGFQFQEGTQNTQSSSVPGSERDNCLRAAIGDRSITRLDFLRLAYGGAWSDEVADYLIASVRVSTQRQYQSVWVKFQDYFRELNPSVVDLNFVFEFLISIFERKKYQVRTLLVYKSALVRPLSVAFKINMSDTSFNELFRSMWIKRPGTSVKVPSWNLDKVLELLSSNRFNINVSAIDLICKCVFLVGLALGNRISEVHSLLRDSKHLKFSRNFKSVTFVPNATFLAKNEAPAFRRNPISIPALFKRDGSPHALCPVDTLRNYLRVTDRFGVNKLFVNPITGVPCNKGRISFYFVRLVRCAQPGSFPVFHDLRKFASWNAFWAKMSWSSMRARGFWRSNSSLGRHYLQGAFPWSVNCVALGRVSHQ